MYLKVHGSGILMGIIELNTRNLLNANFNKKVIIFGTNKFGLLNLVVIKSM